MDLTRAFKATIVAIYFLATATGNGEIVDPRSTRTIALTLSVEEEIPVLGIAQGHLTTLSFQDGNGVPLPIIEMKWPNEMEVDLSASHSHVATLRKVGRRVVEGGLLAFIEGIHTPVHFSVTSKAPSAQRVIVRIHDAKPGDLLGGRAALVSQRRSPPNLDAAIREFLLAHPEVIREALDPVRQLAAKAQLLRAEVLGTDGVPAAGDPMGAVTVVEFFDYGCGYCKRSATAVRETIAKSGVRVELRDYPILGPDSELASRLALAAGLQGRYTDAHFALMERVRGLGSPAAADLAAELGLDATRLEEDMHSAEVSARIEANRALGRRLGIRGTPVFLVVGPETVHVAPGEVDGARIAEMVKAVK